MKPDWKDAPEWAQWLACDECGDWYWYETKPEIEKGCNYWLQPFTLKKECAWSATNWNWAESLEPRP